MRISLAFFLLLISAALHSQNENEALLLHQLSAAKDTARIRLLDELSRYYYEIGAVSLSDSFASVELNEAKKRGDDRLTAIAILRHGQAMDSRGQFDSANAVYDAAIEKLDTNSDRKEYAQALLYKANAFYFKGNTAQAQNLYYRSLVIREAISDSMGMASSMMGMALVLSDIGQKEKSLDYNLQALGILQRQGELKTVSWLYNNIGTNYADMKRNDEALAVFAKSLALKKQLNDRYGISTTYNNIGDIFLEEGRYDSALFYFRMGYNIRRKIDDQHELANSCKLMGMAYLQMNLPDSALPFLDSAQTIGERSGSWDVLKSVYENLALLYAGRGDFRSAFDYEKKFMTARDSVLSEETSRQVNELNARYEDEKKEHQLALKDAEISRGNAFRNLLFGIAALLVVLAVALFTGYRRKRRTSEILAQKNGEIESQKQLVEEKNRDITDSITYARRIQRALLPPGEFIARLFPESFVFYRPKDIVSGDFYLFEEWGKEKIIAAIDCTGHGVPGAFMSFVAYDLFNEAVNEHGITEPSAILTRMQSRIEKKLKQRGENSGSLHDGMDAAVIALSTDTRCVTYAGANRPLWLVRNKELIEFSPDKKAISATDDTGNTPFTKQEITVQPGDSLYLFSDGYADQFGGDKAKKFKISRLKELIVSISGKPIQEQKNILAHEFDSWKGNLEQIDDVLVIGVRI